MGKLEDAEAEAKAKIDAKNKEAADAAALKEAAEKEAERIANEDADPEVEEVSETVQRMNERRDIVEAAANKLRSVAMAYPETTPNEHTIFGFGGIIIHLGDLRDLFDLNRRR